MSLKERTIKALHWTFAERVGMQAVQFCVSVVLARLLSPSDFGLMGMLSLFMLVGQQLIHGGFGQALIQKQNADDADATAVFYFCTCVGVVLVALLYFTAPVIASFYNEPKLILLTRVLSVNLLLCSLMTVHNTLLEKRLQFRPKVLSNVISLPISATVGIWMALKGCGVWSLVGQALSASFCRLLFVWLLFPWRPRLQFHFASLKNMFPYGSRLLASGLLSVFFDSIYYVVIGKAFNQTELGYYYRGHRLHYLSAMMPSQVVGQVTFPAFSLIQNDEVRLLRAVRKAMAFCAGLIFPLMFGTMATASSLVQVIFGEKWLPTVPYLQLLCIAGLFYPLNYVNVNILKARGRSDLFLKLEVVKRMLTVVNIAVTCRIGVSAMLTGHAVCSLLSYLLNVIFLRSVFPYSFFRQILDVFPYFAMSLLIAGMVKLVQVVLSGWPLSLTLFFLVVSSVLIYVLLCLIFQPMAVREGLALLRQLPSRERAS